IGPAKAGHYVRTEVRGVRLQPDFAGPSACPRAAGKADTDNGRQWMEKLMPALSLVDLRRYAVHRSLFTPTTLKRAIEKLGFVQADPIRAPARAQDLTLRHRVKG